MKNLLNNGAMLEPWRVMVEEGRLTEAARLLRPTVTGLEGMGSFAALGYGAEKYGDEVLQNGDVLAARQSYEVALRNFLLYSEFPARGDNEDYGIELAEGVLRKLAALDAAS